MPTYDYVCEKCDHAFEHFQGISEALLAKCPACGKRSLRRLIGSGAGVMFKGSGFYETDYKQKSGAPQEQPAAGKGAPDSAETPAGKEGLPGAAAPAAPAATPGGSDKERGAKGAADSPRTTGASGKAADQGKSRSSPPARTSGKTGPPDKPGAPARPGKSP